MADSATELGAPPAATGHRARAFARAAWLSRGIRADAPWDSPRAAQLDTPSVTEWLDELALGADARYLLERILGSAAVGHLDSTSLLHMLWLLRVAGGPIRSANAAFEWRITEGAQAVAQAICTRLGDRVRLGTPVDTVGQDDDHVVVTGADGTTVRARHAIVAVPVTQLGAIRFEPELSVAHRKLDALRIGGGAKVIGVLPHDHAVGYNSVVGGDILWNCWRRGPRVTGFAPANADPGDEALIADLAAAFRVTPRDLRATTIIRWSDQHYIGGCDAVFAPGQVRELGPILSRPDRRIYFAGAERSSWPDNMEGAVRSGESAASSILAAQAR